MGLVVSRGQSQHRHAPTRDPFRLYFRVDTTALTGTLPGASTESGTSPTETATGASTNRDMTIAMGTTPSVSAGVSASGVAGTSWFRRFLSPKLAAQVIPAGEWSIYAPVSEQFVGIDAFFFGMTIYQWRPSTGTKIATILDLPSSGHYEAPGTVTGLTDTQIATSDVTLLDEDIIVVEIFTVHSTTTGTIDFYYDGDATSLTVNYASTLQAPIPLLLFTAAAGAYTDSATLSSKTAPITTSEIAQFVDSATISSSTTPAVTVEIREALDLTTITSITTPITTAEVHELFDAATITSVSTLIVTDEIAQFIDAATIDNVTSPITTVEVHENVDAATIVTRTYIITTFPTTPILDNFNRANEIPLSTGWSNTGSELGIRLVNNVVTSTSDTDATSYWNAGTFIDCEAYVTTPVNGDATDEIGVLARLGGVGVSSPNWTGYQVILSGSSTTIILNRKDSSSITTIATGTVSARQDGDKIGIRCVGTTIEAWVDQGSGWVKVASVVDATYGSGYLGLYIHGNTGSLDDFGGGVYVAREAAQFVDVATISSVTSPSGTDEYTPSAGTEYLDSATVAGVTALITTVEIAEFTDSNTISNVTSLSAVEIHEIPDTATIASVTTPTTTVEIAQFDDSNTISNVTSLSAVEIHEISDAATISSNTVLSTTEIAQFIDAATITTVTTHSGTDEYTPLTGTEYTDSATLTSITSLSVVELHEIPDDATIASITTLITTVETSQYVDAATINNVTTPITTVELHELFDAASITSVTVPTAVEVADYVDAATIGNVTTPITTVEIHELPDSATITTVTSLSATEIAQYVDSATVSNVTSLTTDAEIHEISDAATVASTTTLISTIEVAEFTDTNTITSVTAPISTIELHEISDAATVSNVTTVITTSEIAQYVDSATVPNVTVLSGEELYIPFGGGIEYTDANTVVTITSLSVTELAEYVDANTVSSTTTLITTAAEITEFVDTDTINSITQLIATSEIVQFVDASTISGVTTPSGTDVYTPAPQNLRPIVDITVGDWLPSTASQPLYSMIDEITIDDADYIYSVAVP